MSVSGEVCREYRWDGHCKYAWEEHYCSKLGSGWKYTGEWQTGYVDGQNCFWYKMNKCYRDYTCPTPNPTPRPTPSPVNPLEQRLKGEDWVSIFNCDGKKDVKRYLYEDWQGLAQRASAVRICTHGSETDCVQSSGTALSNLRSGFRQLQKKGLNWCDTDCVKEEWSGDEKRLGQMWWKCGRPDGRNFWHACGNTEGLHLDNDAGPDLNDDDSIAYEDLDGGMCTWDWEESDNIDVQLLLEPSMAPTSMPSPSPTSDPSATPTRAPTRAPSPSPTSGPSATPTRAPTRAPSPQPTSAPTFTPTTTPTFVPTMAPTVNPTSTPTTAEPSQTPTVAPTVSPTGQPTTAAPTFTPMSYEQYQALCELSNESKEVCQAHALQIQEEEKEVYRFVC